MEVYYVSLGIDGKSWCRLFLVFCCLEEIWWERFRERRRMARKGKNSQLKKEKHQRHQEWRTARKTGEVPKVEAGVQKPNAETRVRHLPIRALKLSFAPNF